MERGARQFAAVLFGTDEADRPVRVDSPIREVGE